MLKAQKGFTLIELVVVIVLLGILGVTALAKFQDVSLQAQNAANAGIASEMSSGSSINYASAKLGAGGTPYILATETCAAAATDLLATGLPAGYSITAGSQDCSGGGSFTCSIDNTANAIDTAAVAIVLCTN
ncbi:MAG: type II secretion system protein [Gammaproteobacteria bacterium]|nr:type II secretion system protein [Gammaproteobacteria bacterium]